jgi:hypothetical protein
LTFASHWSAALLLVVLVMGCERPEEAMAPVDWREAQESKRSEEDFPLHEVPKRTGSRPGSWRIDGRLDEPFWREIPAFSLAPLGRGRQRTTVRVAATDDGILLGAWMEDEKIWATLSERDESLWTEEVLEIFFAPRGPGSPYVELQVNPLGTIFDARFESPPGSSGDRRADIERARTWDLDGLEVAVHVEGSLNDGANPDEFWSVEMWIPFAGLELEGAPPQAGDRWRVNLYRFDRPDQETTHAYAWSTGPRGDFHRVQEFGVWTFDP